MNSDAIKMIKDKVEHIFDEYCVINYVPVTYLHPLENELFSYVDNFIQNDKVPAKYQVAMHLDLVLRNWMDGESEYLSLTHRYQPIKSGCNFEYKGETTDWNTCYWVKVVNGQADIICTE